MDYYFPADPPEVQTMTEPIIREARPNDVSAIVALWKELMDFHALLDPFFTRDENGHLSFVRLLTQLMESGKGLVLVAVDGDRVVGFTQAAITNYSPTVKLRPFGLIYDTMVDNEYRRRGIGARLFAKQKEWFAAMGINRLEVRAMADNELSNAFWRKMGFNAFLINYAQNI